MTRPSRCFAIPAFSPAAARAAALGRACRGAPDLLAPLLALLLALLVSAPATAEPQRGSTDQRRGRHAKPGPTMSEVLAAAKPSDWRALDPARTLYMDLDAGRVVIELAPAFAPRHVANIQALVREGFFDGVSINRVQDNFVVQWGGGERTPKNAQRHLAPEFTRPLRGLPFTRLPDRDVYAPQVGFSDGFPAARDPARGRAWMAHCYGAIGAGRDNDLGSGDGRELYVVIGHAPRQLDRNITVVGRVVWGMELLTALTRGPAPMGMLADDAAATPIRRIRLAADLPTDEHMDMEVLRTDTPTFRALVESRRNRRDAWYAVPAGSIDLCNLPIPVRRSAAAAAAKRATDAR